MHINIRTHQLTRKDVQMSKLNKLPKGFEKHHGNKVDSLKDWSIVETRNWRSAIHLHDADKHPITVNTKIIEVIHR